MLSPGTNYAILIIIGVFFYSISINAYIGQCVLKLFFKDKLYFKNKYTVIRGKFKKDEAIIAGLSAHFILASLVYFVFFASY
ncbi:unnamed protein product [Phage NCTB]|nr:unnamed protein product [Phage NCTB]